MLLLARDFDPEVAIFCVPHATLGKCLKVSCPTIHWTYISQHDTQSRLLLNNWSMVLPLPCVFIALPNNWPVVTTAELHFCTLHFQVLCPSTCACNLLPRSTSDSSKVLCCKKESPLPWRKQATWNTGSKTKGNLRIWAWKA